MEKRIKLTRQPVIEILDFDDFVTMAQANEYIVNSGLEELNSFALSPDMGPYRDGSDPC